MRNLKKFNSQELYNAYILTDDAVSPAIMLNDNNKSLHYYKKQDIPLKYKPLQYIRSTQTGGQYIDTGIGLYDTNPINFKIDMNFMMYGHGKTGQQQSTMLCASQESSPYPGLNIRTSANTNYYIECVYKEAQHYEDEVTNSGKYCCAIYDVNGTRVYTHGTSWKDARNYLLHFEREFNFSASQSHNITTSLFCSKNGSGDPWRFLNARLDYCKLYKNGVIVRDFVPCLNPEGIAGLYDKVTKQFYKSQGTEEFVAGPSI